MKNKIIIIALAILTPLLLFNFYYPSENITQTALPPVPGSMLTKFYFGAMENHHAIKINNNNYDELGFNLWHSYTDCDQTDPNRRKPKGRFSANDLLDNPVSLYEQDLKNKIDEIYPHSQSKLLWQRPKIEWLCYGQSSIYEAETKSPDHDLWFYSFNESSGQIQRDFQWNNGDSVLYCNDLTLSSGARFVLKRLKANTEQCNRMTGTHPSNYWFGDSECDWLVKPKIRIPPSFVPGHEETDVCKIHIITQDGLTDKIQPVTIKAKHFRKNNQPGNEYDGRYLEEFFFTENPSAISFTGDLGDQWEYKARGESPTDDGLLNKADIQVEWLGNCEMWIDYVKVENDVADKLLKGYYDDPNFPDRQWIKNEVELAKYPPQGSNEPAVWKFYIELSEFNHHPCMAYVNERLKYYSGGQIDLMADYTNMNHAHVPWSRRNSVSNAGFTNRNYVQQIGLTQIFAESYPLTGSYNLPPTFSKIPSTLPVTSGWGILAQAISPGAYDVWLQDNINHSPYVLETDNTEEPQFVNRAALCRDNGLVQDEGNYRFVMKVCSEVSRMANIPFIFMPQAHLWHTPGEVRREPTNEELEMMSYVAVSYGAKGFNYFWYPGSDDNDPNCPRYTRGIADDENGIILRVNNVYSESRPKWQAFRDIGVRVKKWEQHILNFTYSDTRSYIYDEAASRSDLLANKYFSEIKTYAPDNSNINSPSDAEEPVSSRYVQAGLFKKFEEPYSNYFMLVNRRCSPYFAPGVDPRFPDGENGGRRFVKVSFKESELQYFTNWKIVDLENNNVVTTFNKNGSPFIDLGWYLPGEGKLYKLAPVMVDGGTLAYDENLNMTPAYECYNTVYNGGKNISLYPSNSISFTHLGRIVMNGGSFQSGLLTGDQGRVTLHSEAVNSPVISFENCTSVRIYNTDVSCYYNNSYLFSITNCPLTDIQNTNISPPENAGGIGYFAAYSILPSKFNLNISNNNHFVMSSTSLPALNIMAFGGVQVPLICSGNYFISTGNNSSTAINLLNVSGGILQNNSISGFNYGVNTLSTNTALYHNNISSSVNTSYGLNLVSGTVVDMSYTGFYLLGSNYIGNTGSTSSNIYVDNSYYLMNSGYNTFNITSNSSSYHLTGTFPLSGGLIDLDNKLNCFKQDQNNSTPVKSVNWYGGGEVQFNFLPFSCNDNQEEDGFASADLGDGIIDSIAFNNGTQLTVYDSLGLEMRKRNYIAVISMCNRILNDPPDTIQAIDAVSKLYTATISTDTSETGITLLKDFYSYVILNNPANPGLVRNCYYFVQKCKVNLHQYSSALAGFEQIINENPYSYEALVAHWDYMAVYILDSLSGGGEQGDGDDRNSRLTNEQKTYVKDVVKNIYESERMKEENNMNRLVSEANDGNEISKLILSKKRTLKDVVQNQSPHNILEHINIVNSDIKKVFGKYHSESRNSSNIPTVYRLSQNYPNPFNPVTKINYDLPKDAKVNIVIYDILGREVKRLVNNELKTAGTYIIDFNASNYASGVYFYRIEAEEPGGNKFVDSKKMVLIK